jgi:hypothetical protein
MAGFGRSKAWVRRAAALAILASTTPAAAESVKTARAWVYLSGTVVATPWLAFTAMPGVRYEVSRSRGDAVNYYMNELFVGPSLIHKTGPVTLKLGTWYYYTGYPNSVSTPAGAEPSYHYQHSFELIPTVDYKAGDFTFTSRTIFHNTFYASAYKTPTANHAPGFGTVIRELVQAKYDVSKLIGLIAADEPFFGVIEDSDTKDMKLNAIGFWKSGFRMNRVYLGVELRPVAGLSLLPEYVFETLNGEDGTVIVSSHYLFLTAAFTYKAYDTPKPAPQPPVEAPRAPGASLSHAR